QPRYARVRLRQALAGLDDAGLGSRLGRTARQLRQARVALDLATVELLVRIAAPHEAGFARVDRAGLVAAPAQIGLPALASVLGVVGDARCRPRFDGLEGLWPARASAGPWRARTLQGCRILAADPAGEQLLVVREPAALPPPVNLAPGSPQRWDRFRITTT